MRYNAIARIGTLIVGGILTATAVASFGAPLVASQRSNEVPPGVTMSLGAYQAQRALEVQEDEVLWDCRINGNGVCGDTAFELVCPPVRQTPGVVCTLESHPA